MEVVSLTLTSVALLQEQGVLVDKLRLLKDKYFEIDMCTFESTLKTIRDEFSKVLSNVLGTWHFEDAPGRHITTTEMTRRLRDPEDEIWQSPALKERLSTRLGQECGNFEEYIKAALDIMREVGSRLDQRFVEKPGTARESISKYKQKVKHVFTRARTSSQSQTLRILVKNMKKLGKTAIPTYGDENLEQLLVHNKEARTNAYSLYQTLSDGSCWGCDCPEHRIHVMLCQDVENRDLATIVKLRMFPPRANLRQRYPNFLKWQEVDIKSITNLARTGAAHTTSNHTQTTHDPAATSEPIANMCSILGQRTVSMERPESIGHMAQELTASEISITRTVIENLEIQSLEEVIRSQPASGDTGNFSHQLTRVRVAAKLACAVLQFYGTLLQEDWSSGDIRFQKKVSPAESLDRPFFEWRKRSSPEDLGQPISSATIDKTLLSLGRTLVELAVLCNIDHLQTSRGEDVTGHSGVSLEILYKTGTRLGKEYQKVVEKCLMWPKGQKEDHIFQFVVVPLIRVMRHLDRVRV